MAIYSPTGWIALYRQEERLHSRLPVERFSDSGRALVVDEQRGELRDAASQPGFVGLEACSRMPVSVVMAPPGWRVLGTDAWGAEWSEVVLAWAVDDIGTGWPVIPHRDEGTLEIQHADDGRVVLRSPDEPTE